MPRKTVEQLGSVGVVRDTPAHKLTDSAWSDASNMRFSEKGAEALVGNLSVFSAASITPLWLQAFPTIVNPHWAYGDLTSMWVFEGSTHTDITRVSGAYAGLASERWHGAMLNGIGIFNNTVDIPQAWNVIAPGTPLIDLPNWTSTRRCKSLRSFKNFLIALGMTDSGTSRPYRVLWSDSADAGTVPGSWDSTDPATDSREFDLAETPDHLVDQLGLGDINVIYKENSTWGMQFIGPPFYFRFWKILSNSGLLTRDCAVSVPFGHVVVTQNDIILHSGQLESSQSIIDDKLRNWLFSAIDVSTFYNSFLVSDPRRNEVLFCFPEIGQTFASMAVVWNWRDKSCGIRVLNPVTPFVATGPLGSTIDDDEEWGA